MRFKILDTKWKKQRRLEIMLLILADGPVMKFRFEYIYFMVIKALDYDWIHPKW